MTPDADVTLPEGCTGLDVTGNTIRLKSDVRTESIGLKNVADVKN